MKKRKLILYISCSLDGFIAAPGDDLSFLERVQQEGEDYGYTEFTKTVDTVIMGRRTYDWILSQGVDYPHKDKTSYIIAREQKEPKENVHFYTGRLTELAEKLKNSEGKNIFCDGGGFVVGELLKNKLLDELIVSVIPVLLGSGTRLFSEGIPVHDLRLEESRSFESGLVQFHYAVIPS